MKHKLFEIGLPNPLRYARQGPRNFALLYLSVITSLLNQFSLVPACFPNGKVGMMDTDLSRLQPISKHNRVGYAAVTAVVAILPKKKAMVC
jgi:hypothetical protein